LIFLIFFAEDMVAALQQKERDLILAAELGKVRPHPKKSGTFLFRIRFRFQIRLLKSFESRRYGIQQFPIFFKLILIY
jgi:hypothetical protein